MTHTGQGLFSIAIADPTQAASTIHLEFQTSVLNQVMLDSGITVDQLSPTLKLTINVKASAGKTFRATFRTAQPLATRLTAVSAASYSARARAGNAGFGLW
jgi:hyaluronate lyase